jgi:hypothetical protein
MRMLSNAAVLGCLCGAIVMSAANPIIGPWKLNSAKTRSSPGPPPKAVTAVYSQEGDWIIAKMTGVDAAGRPFNRTHRYKQDGREYPSEWGPPAQGVRGMLSVKKIDDHTAEVVLKFEDGASITRQRVISKDGNTMTFTDSGTTAKGETINSVMVWERQ